MKKITRKWILAIVLVVIGIFLAISVRSSIKFELGNKVSYEVPSRYQRVPSGIMVFCYHRVLKDTRTVRLSEDLSSNSQFHDFNVNSNDFKNQMTYLHQHHIEVISTKKMIQLISSHRPLHHRYVVLTFDDIDRTTVDNALPVMLKFHYPFTVSIITGNTGEYRAGTKLATWSQIIQMKKKAGDLIDFGVHTNNMHYLTSNGTPVFNVPSNFSRFKGDYALSQKVLKKEIGSKTNIFTYPYGSGDTQVQSFLQEQPLKVIYTLNTGIVRRHSDLKNTPRIIVNSNSWPSIKKWLTHPEKLD
ncbi:polysaccharide deacetylase family protein [Pediococcus claussenii]|uniref:Polysaccharide deacetylase family protein n=1 Tax=Pediococcus claussenii (strain ATCC BAA-344 / DSM 14800 / JCM 18046 / KCTC 3811 / LMG 21948 / P06) TaxID=701521 RepID=G8PAV1_PEDCP|nr:polysaccharide deacetylase family protein [Pediococcus claussenii]AEV95819.1 polysaccharide deacetylase family protein [Pediococcus claussenii ATCC BAA-344]ANZ69316.1 polysaccharide deacetylase [Pediococcus claussenii]ANZ71136.1 polysaccharide deacetylase [Pediococcus claussenii]KRN20426.1 hypothetical protein IV79_GL000481 [Pediococcus claussenii]